MQVNPLGVVIALELDIILQLVAVQAGVEDRFDGPGLAPVPVGVIYLIGLSIGYLRAEGRNNLIYFFYEVIGANAVSSLGSRYIRGVRDRRFDPEARMLARVNYK